MGPPVSKKSEAGNTIGPATNLGTNGVQNTPEIGHIPTRFYQ